MKRLVALAGLTAPLLVITPSAFAATGVGVITTPTTSSSTGSLSTSAVTGTVTQAVTTVTQPVTTTTAAPTTSSTVSTSSTPTSSTSPTTALSGLLSPPTSTSTTSSSASSSSSTTSTPAPPGTSEAYAAEVAGVVAISHTKATANGNPNDSSATADPLELGGQPVVGGTVSGSKGGQSQGTLFGPGDPTSSANPLAPLGLEVMPYDATVTNSSTGQTSHADSSLLTLLLPDSGGPTVYADVLHSESNAAYTYGTNGNPDTSSGSTTSYGAHINLGGTSPSDTCASNNCLDIYLLYSHTDSSGQGNAYLASINGNQIVNASQVANQCNIPLNPLIDIVCVYATGGTGTTGSTSGSNPVTQTAGVLTGTSQSGLPTLNLFTGQTTPAKGGALSGSNNGGSNNGNNNQTSGNGNGNGGNGNGGNGNGNGGNGGGATPSVVTAGLQPGAASTAAASTLPFTGFNAALVALLGGFLAMVGVALRRSGAIARPRA